MDSTQINNTASKLPIKRKTLDEEPTSHSDVSASPPFKFQRVWGEADEIRFVQGLLDCAADGLSFPRDLSIFYGRFANSMSQPYTKSQLYEKLRRLKNKFRAMTGRTSKGFDPARLSAHDRELYEMSRRLWHEDFADTSPFGKVERPGLVGVKVGFSPTLSVVSNDDENSIEEIELPNGAEYKGNDGFCSKSTEANVIESKKGCGRKGPEKLSEVTMEVEGDKNCETDVREDGGLRQVVANAVTSSFDECLEDLRGKMDGNDCGNECFCLRWQRQKVEEYDVLARRVRLVLQDFVRRQ